MGFFDKETKGMLEVYMIETSQLIEQLNVILLNSEENQCLSLEDIQNIFRIMHTMKSSSAMMGLEGLSQLTHKMEDIFSVYRDYGQDIQIDEADLFNLLFDVFDFNEKELGLMNDDNYMPVSCEALIEKAKQYHQRLLNKQNVAIKQETFDVENYFKGDGKIVKITFEKECRMENVRAFMLVHQIEKKCQSIQSYPADLDDSQNADIIQKVGFYLCITTSEFDEVFKTLENGLFVSKCEEITRQSKNVKNQTTLKTSQIQLKKLDTLENISNEIMMNVQYVKDHLKEMGVEDFDDSTLYHLEQLSKQLEETIIQMRLVPIKQIVPKLKRTLRDICQSQNKDVDFIIHCGEIEADQKIVEHLSEALIHILRNAVDHGIEDTAKRLEINKSEKGQIVFDVEIRRGELYISISDDGKGIDVQKIYKIASELSLTDKPIEDYTHFELLNFILTPGFTTNKEVTQYSGRGVGLDVVAHILEEIGGHIYIESELNKGSTFILTLPLSLTTIDSTCFILGEYHCSIPSKYVTYFQNAQLQQVQEINGKKYITLNEELIPFLDLYSYYEVEKPDLKQALLIYFKTATQQGCLLVDQVESNQRLVMKRLPVLLGGAYRNLSGISGISLLSKAHICLNLDVEILIEKWKAGKL